MMHERAKPCELCGTTGGFIGVGRSKPKRVHGLCNRCHRLDSKPPRQPVSLERRPGDPTPWEIALAEIAIRFKARGLARARFRLMECARPVQPATYHKPVMRFAYLFEDNPR